MTGEATQDTAGPVSEGVCGCCGGSVDARPGSPGHGRTLDAALRAERNRFETLWNESQAENERLAKLAYDQGVEAERWMQRAHAAEEMHREAFDIGIEWQRGARESQDLLAIAREENERLTAALFRHGMQRTCRRVLNEEGDVWRSLDADLERDGHYCKEPSVGVVWMSGGGWRGFCDKHRPHERADFILRGALPPGAKP